MHKVPICVGGLLTVAGGVLANDSVSAITVDSKELTIGLGLVLAGSIVALRPLLVAGGTRRTKHLLTTAWVAVLLIIASLVSYQASKILGVDAFQITEYPGTRRVLRTPLGKTLLYPGENRLVMLKNRGYWFVPAQGVRTAHWYESHTVVIDPCTGEEIEAPTKFGYPSN